VLLLAKSLLKVLEALQNLLLRKGNFSTEIFRFLTKLLQDLAQKPFVVFCLGCQSNTLTFTKCQNCSAYDRQDDRVRLKLRSR